MGSVISITTDFGNADGYQGVLEGVIAGINPEARVVPISHEIPSGDIIGGWYLLKTHYRYFPPGSVHLAVIDPGVGSKRKILAVRTRRAFFVAPDNGLLSFIPPGEIISIHSITNPEYALAEISPVFHGRDIMAPAAAYLSLGIDPACLGRACKNIVMLKGVNPVRRGKTITGKIIWVDRFGNLITNLTRDKLSDTAVVRVNGETLGLIRRTFSDVRRGLPLAYIGSGGHLELAVREGSAAEFFAYEAGNVQIEVAPE